MTVRNVTCIRRVVVDGNVYCPDPRVAPHRASIQPPIEALGCSRCARSDWNQLPLGVGRAAIAILGIDLTDSSAKEISPMGRAKVDSPDRPSALLAIVFIGDDCKGKRERERERERGRLHWTIHSRLGMKTRTRARESFAIPLKTMRRRGRLKSLSAADRSYSGASEILPYFLC